MTLRLSVHRQSWLSLVNQAATQRPGLIPVVKGNGYGFGRATLMPVAAQVGATTIAVGTVFEAHDVPHGATALVLTPHLGPLPATLPASAILTVGNEAHIRSLAQHAWRGGVVLKLRSSMRRYGCEPQHLPSLISAITAAKLTLVGYGLHFPLTGDEDDFIGEVAAWLPALPPALPLAVSHLSPAAYARIIAAYPERRFQLRVGTALWHADRPSLALRADAVDKIAVAAGQTVGYAGKVTAGAGHIVHIGAGSAQGVQPHTDGRSPFHFANTRLALIEPPHMHTSMAFVPTGDPCPEIGDWVDVQRPLTTIHIDELEWIDD